MKICSVVRLTFAAAARRFGLLENPTKSWTVLGIAGLFIVFVGVATAAMATTPFVRETVEATGDVGKYSSLVLDGQGNPHVSYYDGTNDILKYAVKVNGQWVIETVTYWWSNGGQYTSIALDAQGRPHISYSNADISAIMYAVMEPGGWRNESVDFTGSVGRFTSLALDAQGIPHVSYLDDSNGDLRYAMRLGSYWWVTEAVDSPGDVGQYSSLELDTEGTPHISYLDSTNLDLKYAVKTGGIWITERVDSNGSVGWNCSLALDEQGKPHISYLDGTNFDLKYAVKIDGSWSSETVDVIGKVGFFTSLAFDGHGNPHISYYDETNSDLKYAVKIGGSWSTETVDAAGLVGWHSSVALDAEGNPHISYHDLTNSGLKFADSGVHLTSPAGGEQWLRGGQADVTWKGIGVVDILLSTDGGLTYTPVATEVSGGSKTVDVPGVTTVHARIKIERASPLSTSTCPDVFSIVPNRVWPWWAETVDATTDVARFSSLRLDGQATPHVSYYDAINNDLKYAVKTGGNWSTETADSAGDVGQYSSLAIDDLGRAHISYLAYTIFDLKYAVRTGGIWVTETVDSAGSVGFFTSLALDGQGNPHISYYDETVQELKYAVKTGGGWTTETVDATGWETNPSLELDEHGNPHISYWGGWDADSLKYAVKSGGIWSTETVDRMADEPSFTSLELDAQGNPHIGYRDFQYGDLKYAVKKDGSWNIDLIEEAGVVGEPISLALDGGANPHIVYRRITGYDLLQYAVKKGGSWTIETVDATGGSYTSLELDKYGNPHISYQTDGDGELRYVTGAVDLGTPSGGDTWPVGATRTVSWDGVGTIDISLSVDGGNSFTLVASNAPGGSYDLIVPHTPSKFSLVRIERCEEENDFGSYVYPHSVSESDSFFTIEMSVELLTLLVLPSAGGPGLVVSWSTDPGPEDLDGYRLEKRRGSGDWLTLVSLTKDNSHYDRDGVPGERYRLFAVNGLGEELYLGEASDGNVPSFGGRLVAWPVPFRDGELNVSFPTGGPGGGTAHAEVVVYDVAGRRVKTIASGTYPFGVRQVKWDGRDENGRLVASGIYFIRATSDGLTAQTRKLVIVR